MRRVAVVAETFTTYPPVGTVSEVWRTVRHDDRSWNLGAPSLVCRGCAPALSAGARPHGVPPLWRMPFVRMAMRLRLPPPAVWTLALVAAGGVATTPSLVAARLAAPSARPAMGISVSAPPGMGASEIGAGGTVCGASGTALVGEWAAGRPFRAPAGPCPRPIARTAQGDGGVVPVVHTTRDPAPGARLLGAPRQSDLDAFMARVLARRDENWKKLQQYILDERETVEVLAPGRVRIYGHEREYTWFVRQGYFVRSPLRVDGVAIGEAERRAYEARWIARERGREARAAAAARGPAGSPASGEPTTSSAPAPGAAPVLAATPSSPPASPPRATSPATAPSVPSAPAPAASSTPDAPPAPADVGDVLRQALEPRFVSAAYFLKFEFEPGRYVFAGRETVDGHELLRIEYYPTRLFRDSDDGRQASRSPGKRGEDEEIEERLEQQMNKVALVTLWVEPRAHQIVRYTFENVGFDFLPGRWLVRVDAVEARMEMHESFPGIWLPRGIVAHVALAVAAGTYDVRFIVTYLDYRQPDVKVRIR